VIRNLVDEEAIARAGLQSQKKYVDESIITRTEDTTFISVKIENL
jgi:hypothetical protein